MTGAASAHGALPYRQALASALARYHAVTGERPDPGLLDPGRPEVQRAYRAFARAPFAIGLRPALGEELALRMGLKPVLRLLTAPAGAGELAARFEADGFATRVLRPGLGQSAIDGSFERVQEAAGPRARVLLYAGRDPSAVEEAAALDGEMVQARLPARTMARHTRRLGSLLGYPACCVEAFAALGCFDANAGPIGAAAARSARFDPLLANVSLSVCHLVAWFPCRYDCPASLGIARAVEERLAREAPAAVAALRRYQAMPRLYADDRRQILLDGELVAPGRVRYRAVHTPYAFDRRPEEAAYEWVFFAVAVAPLLGGGELEVGEDRLEHLAPDGTRRRLPRPAGAVWLPFAPAA